MSSAPWPKDSRGTVSVGHMACALCGEVVKFPRPFSQAHYARKYARMSGWTYLEPFGWICGCRARIPGVLEQVRKAKQTTGRRHSSPDRIQVQLKIL